MRSNRLSISRPVIETDEVRRFTAKITNCAQATFGHDESTLVRGGEFSRSTGNPRFKILSALEYCALYRAGLSDPRNKASSSTRAKDALLKSPSFESGTEELRNMYDGLDFSRMRIYCDDFSLGTKPGYEKGEYQLVLQPRPELTETGFLISEAQLCSSVLAEVSPRFGFPESQMVPGIPILKLNRDITAEERSAFIEKVRSENVLPAVFELGELELEAQDKTSL